MDTGTVTFRDPTDAPQAVQRYSWSSPSGRTRSSRSRTGCADWQRAQNRTVAWSSPKAPGGPGRRACIPYE